MNLCQCCHDEVTGSWCGCEEKHDQDMSVMAEARARVNNIEIAGQWSFYCTACNRYTSGSAYYID